MSNSESPNIKYKDTMSAYEYLVDHAYDNNELISNTIQYIIETDTSGQFSASAARYLHAIDHENFSSEIDSLLRSTIEKDKEKHYLPALLPTIWGENYMAEADDLREKDDNFRRIFKRVHPTGII